MKAIAPNNLEITGTLEVVTGRALITFCEPGEEREETEGCLSFCFDGETEIFWNEQRTERTDEGLRIFLDDEGGQWTEKDVSLVPDCFAFYGQKHADAIVLTESGQRCETCDYLERCKETSGGG